MGSTTRQLRIVVLLVRRYERTVQAVALPVARYAATSATPSLGQWSGLSLDGVSASGSTLSATCRRADALTSSMTQGTNTRL